MGRGNSLLSKKGLRCPPDYIQVFFNLCSMSPAPYPNPSRTFYSSTTSWLWELQEWRKVVPVPRGAWETLGLLGKDTCRDFPACWPYSGDWEGAQANLWIIVPSFHSSTRTWSFLHRFLNNFWETQKGTQYLGLSLRSLRILLKNSQNPGPRTLLTANCDHTGRKRGKKGNSSWNDRGQSLGEWISPPVSEIPD